MNKEQKQFKLLIKADLHIVELLWDSTDKAERLQAAYHMQQAVEKTIKLVADINGLNLWGHDIKALINQCESKGIDLDIPKYVRDRAYQITQWEADCRYYPTKSIRKDVINKVYEETVAWIGKIK